MADKEAVRYIDFTLPSSIISPGPKEDDDSWLDKEIKQQEEDDFSTHPRPKQSQFFDQQSPFFDLANPPQQSQLADLGADLARALINSSLRGKGLTMADSTAAMRPKQSQSADLAAAIKDSSINWRGKGYDYVPVKIFKDVPLPPSWIRTPRPQEDDSWLDKEIEEEKDAHMKEILIDVKQTMKRRTNEAKRKFIFEERMRIVEREQYANDMNSTEGFEVGEYPYMSRQLVGSFITRYYCPPETTITDYELDKLTSFAKMAIDKYNITHNTKFGNVLVIKAMRSFSGGGLWYYLTFQASLPDHPPQMFETQVYDAPHWVSPPVTIEFVRRKKHQPN